mmetsp:Transcript_49791/g.115584  ORF Transcript_49791/g.115584 Transcript_49791/m.115584 type:complete len:256 (-) Transcript_49791:1411-2178(-)
MIQPDVVAREVALLVVLTGFVAVPPSGAECFDLNHAPPLDGELVAGASRVRPLRRGQHGTLLEVLVLRDLLPIRTKGARVADTAGILYEVRDAHPELPVVDASESCRPLHLICPLALLVEIRPLAFPFVGPPWVAAADQLVARSLDDAEHGVDMPTDEARIKGCLTALALTTKLALLWREVARQQPTVPHGLLQELEVGLRVAAVGVLDLDGAAHTAKKAEDCLAGEAPVAHLVARVELAVRLFQQAAPHLLRVS